MKVYLYKVSNHIIFTFLDQSIFAVFSAHARINTLNSLYMVCIWSNRSYWNYNVPYFNFVERFYLYNKDCNFF